MAGPRRTPAGAHSAAGTSGAAALGGSGRPRADDTGTGGSPATPTPRGHLTEAVTDP